MNEEEDYPIAPTPKPLRLTMRAGPAPVIGVFARTGGEIFLVNSKSPIFADLLRPIAN
jgi:hypothetical protein